MYLSDEIRYFVKLIPELYKEIVAKNINPLIIKIFLTTGGRILNRCGSKYDIYLNILFGSILIIDEFPFKSIKGFSQSSKFLIKSSSDS